MECLFNSSVFCMMDVDNFTYCGNCKKVPDMSQNMRRKSRADMDYLICNAVGYDRKRREKNYDEGPKWLDDEVNRVGSVTVPCTDHRRYIDYRDERVLVNEPYHSSMEEIKNLIDFCEKRNLTFTITGDSVHLPGSTFRIIISK